MKTLSPLIAAALAFGIGWVSGSKGLDGHKGQPGGWVIGVGAAVLVLVLGWAWTRPLWWRRARRPVSRLLALLLFAVAIGALSWAIGSVIGGHHHGGQLAALVTGVVALGLGIAVVGPGSPVRIGLICLLAAAVVIALLTTTSWHATKGLQLSRWWSVAASAALVVILLAVVELIVSSGQTPHPRAPAAKGADAKPLGAGKSVSLTPDEQAAAYRRRGLRAVYVGVDGRVSTSKLQFAMWTLAVLFMLIDMWLQSSCFGGGTCHPVSGSNRQVNDIANLTLLPEYWALLGLPAGAAAYAMALVKGTSVDKAAITASEQDGGIVQGLRETASDDTGSVDIGDLQYFLFNLVGIGFVLVTFLQHPYDGLPHVPGTLLGLMGVSATTYGVKKTVVSADKPLIRSTTPRELILGVDPALVIEGAGFLLPGVAQATSRNDVLIGGRSLRMIAGMAETDPLSAAHTPLVWTKDRVTVHLREYPNTASATAALTGMGLSVSGGRSDTTVVVRDSRGIESDAQPLLIRARP
jgi:hypothetical protein